MPSNESELKARYDVVIVGAGIVGLAHAWMAARCGLKVLVCERNAAAFGASIRNFGMIWPIGQPAGELYELALRSRRHWLELGAAGVVEVHECGAILMAHHEDELSVIEEFTTRGSHQASMLTPNEIVQRASLANPHRLLGGMWSPTELRVNPRVACARIAQWLGQTLGVHFQFQTSIVNIEGTMLYASDGRQWIAERIVVCSGNDLQTLYPEVLRHSGLMLCKLQMLRSAAQPQGRQTIPHLAGGLTLRHYKTFENCSAIDQLKERVTRQTPELDRFGIHVMASQLPNGEVLLGDSHEYGDDISPFDKAVIDEILLRELSKVIQLQNWTVEERWHGIYAKHPNLPWYTEQATDTTLICLGAGGGGMTMSFALAEAIWQRWTG